jgi:hypothetical protein
LAAIVSFADEVRNNYLDDSGMVTKTAVDLPGLLGVVNQLELYFLSLGVQ